eukprot:jgi/Chrzof1/14113/Cz08g25170.t1
MDSVCANPNPNRPVLLYTPWANKHKYKQLLQDRGLKIVYAEDVNDWNNVNFAVMWKPPAGMLSRCGRLQAVMSLGAGVDHLLEPGLVPVGIPILRIVDPLMAARMATWVLWGVISWQRKMEYYSKAQQLKQWDTEIEGRTNMDNHAVRIGVLGFGLMGRTTAETLASLGYKVSAWGRTHKQHPTIQTFAGPATLQEFVSCQDVLICLLPLTQHTTGIVDKALLSHMPRGGAFINGARGAHVVEDDLLQVMDSGHLDFALLDVFQQEPLPKTSRLWGHPSIRITPHVASVTTMETAADQIAANYHSLVAGSVSCFEGVVQCIPTDFGAATASAIAYSAKSIFASLWALRANTRLMCLSVLG